MLPGPIRRGHQQESRRGRRAPVSTQRTMAARVVARVLFVAKRRATMHEQPRTVTQACRRALPSPNGQVPQSVQSPWLWMPGLEADQRLAHGSRTQDPHPTSQARDAGAVAEFSQPAQQDRAAQAGAGRQAALDVRPLCRRQLGRTDATRVARQRGGRGIAARTVRQLSPNSRARALIDQPCRCATCRSIQVSSDSTRSLLSGLQLQQPEPDRGTLQLSTQTKGLRSNPEASALFIRAHGHADRAQSSTTR